MPALAASVIFVIVPVAVLFPAVTVAVVMVVVPVPSSSSAPVMAFEIDASLVNYSTG